MGLRVALGCSLARSAVAALVVAALAGACAFVFRPVVRSRPSLAVGRRRSPHGTVRPRRVNDAAPRRTASADGRRLVHDGPGSRRPRGGRQRPSSLWPTCPTITRRPRRPASGKDNSNCAASGLERQRRRCGERSQSTLRSSRPEKSSSISTACRDGVMSYPPSSPPSPRRLP